MPNLIEVTMLDDTRRVYEMGIGVSWEDLSDDEKKMLYESEVYLNRKAALYKSELLKEMENVTGELISLLRRLEPGIVIELPTEDE